MADSAGTTGPGRRLLTVVMLLAAGSAALWISSMLVWGWRVENAGGTSVARPLRGSEFQPALAGLAVVGLAAVAGVLATGGWLRRSIGLLVAGAGAGALIVAGRGLLEPRTRQAADAGFERWHDEINRWAAESAAGIGLAGLAGVLLLAGGVIVLVAGPRMPRMGSRYQAPAGRRPAERTLWDELDAGRDPTG